MSESLSSRGNVRLEHAARGEHRVNSDGRLNRTAVVAFVAAAIGVGLSGSGPTGIFTAPIAIVLGVVALWQIHHALPTVRGKALAVTSLILGVAVTAFALVSMLTSHAA